MIFVSISVKITSGMSKMRLSFYSAKVVVVEIPIIQIFIILAVVIVGGEGSSVAAASPQIHSLVAKILRYNHLWSSGSKC